jgi:PAS domain S-box-containing protein
MDQEVLIIFLLYALTGIMIYAAVHHVASAIAQRDRAQWLFACMCLMIVPMTLSYEDMLLSTTIDSYTRALKWNIAGPMLYFMLFPWFIAAYTRRSSVLYATTASMVFAVLFVVNLVQPFSIQYDSISAIHTLVLPWGDTVHSPTGHNNVWAYVAVAAILMVLGHALYTLGRTYLRTLRGTDLAMSVAVALFLLGAIEGILVRLSIIDSIYLGPFGFLAVVVAMSGILSFESRARLQESENRLKTIIEQSPVAICLYLNGLCVEVNKAFLRLFGLDDPDNIRGMPITNVVVPEARSVIAERAHRRDRGLQSEHTYETIGLRKDGSQFPLSITAAHIKLDEGALNIAYLTDITDRKRAHDVEKRLLRTVTLLSRNNALIARVSDEQELLEGACKLAVNVGGYLMAWVGVSQEDGLVKPIARSGYEDGYLESIRISCLDEPEGRGPTGTAIRTGKASVAQDILNNPLKAVWHEPARQRGYNSSIALPLYFEQQVMGALTIYSIEPYAFSDDEVRLLEELMNDLSFGIASLRLRKDKEAALHELLESEQKLRGLYELSPLGIALREFNGPYVDFNESYRTITGYDADELKNIDNWELTPSEYREAELKQIQSLMMIGRYGPYEKEYIRKDGTRIPVRLSGVMVLGKDGRNYIWSIIEDISESRRVQKEIQDSAEQLRNLLGNYESTLEAERAHIAREIHDELGQTLTSLRFELSALRLSAGEENLALTEFIGTMSNLTDIAIHVTRNVAENLRPVAMNMGIEPAIEWLCNNFMKHSGVPCHLLVTSKFEDMEQAQVDVLFRIAQESLTNIQRHAHARNVAMTLSMQDSTVQLRIADDGIGFVPDYSKRPKSFGLLGMQERAAMMGGRLDIQSLPGHGTVVAVQMPLKIIGEER